MSNLEKLAESLELSLKHNHSITESFQTAFQRLNKFKTKCNLARTLALPGRILGYTALAALPLHNYNEKGYSVVSKVLVGSYLIVGCVEGAICYFQSKNLEKYKDDVNEIDSAKKSGSVHLKGLKEELEALGIAIHLVRDVESILLKPLPDFDVCKKCEVYAPFDNLYERIFIGGFLAAAPLVRIAVGEEHYTRELVKGFIGVYAVGQLGFLIHGWVYPNHPATKHGKQALGHLETERKLCELLRKEILRIRDIRAAADQ